MNKIELFQTLTNSIWAINEDALNKSIMLAVGCFKLGSFEISEKEIEANTLACEAYHLIAQEGLAARSTDPTETQSSIAVIPILNALTPEGYYGVPGTDEIQVRVKAAEADPNVKAILYIADSPGGTVKGTERTEKVIKSSTKPSIAYVKGGAFSAAYWLICSCDHIMLDGETTGVGSIGTMFGGLRLAGILEKMGAVDFSIVAKDSPDKNKAVKDALAGDEEAFQVEVLMPLNAQFKSSVKSGRGDKLKLKEHDPNKVEPISGKVYFGSNAIEWGLADSIGSFDDAVALAFAMGGIEIEHQSTQSNSNTNMLNKFKALSALAAKQKKGEAIAAEEIEAVNAELVSQGITGYVLADAETVEANETQLEAAAADRSAIVSILEPEATEEEAAEYNLTEGVQALADALVASEAQVEKLGAVVPKPAKPVSTSKKPEISSEEETKEEFYSDADAELDAILEKVNN